MAEFYDMYRYDSVEGTIANGVLLQSVGFVNVTHKCYYLSITNDDNSGSLTLRVHANTNDVITVGPRETLTLNNIAVNGVFLSNTSGAGIAYRIQIWGD